MKRNQDKGHTRDKQEKPTDKGKTEKQGRKGGAVLGEMNDDARKAK